MDVVHHACIGAAGMLVLGEQGHELAGLGFLAGSVFPDLDVAFMAAGKRFYLKRHQGPTHSLPFAPFYAAVLAALPAAELGWDWSLFAGLLAGLAGHVVLDLANTFGIQLLWPVMQRRFCADAVFFVDLWAWALTAGFFVAVLAAGASPTAAAAIYVPAFVAYVLAKAALQRFVLRRTGAAIAIPSAWNPLEFFLLRREDGIMRTSRHRALGGRELDARAWSEPEAAVLELARASPVFRDLSAILRALHVTRVEREADGTRLVAQDLAIRNFGGRFGRTELRFDAEGRLVHEIANI